MDGNQVNEAARSEVAIGNFGPVKKGSHHTPCLLRRMARDCPDLLERYERTR